MNEKCLNLEKLISICCWNLNGVHNKFMTDDVSMVFGEK